jgi:hypothetical protein
VYPTSAGPPRNECAEQLDRIPVYPFHVAYVLRARDSSGKARGFTLTLTEKTRLGGRPKVVWIDETGLRRHGIVASGGRVDSVRLAAASSLSAFLIVQHLIDQYARDHGELPARIAYEGNFRDGPPPPGVLAADMGDCTESINDAEDPAASCLERWERVIVYHPIKDASGRYGTYTLTMRPVTYYDNERYQPVPSRTHHRDAAGALHSFGGYRSARDTDPAPADDELKAARESLGAYIRDREAEARRRRKAG